ncbi:solute carrier family 4 member 11-like isoform X2 [Clavelina lepadiformis]|uniref:solute carrier family 4 member 11-like isoform X2 n=1 Tax=Clavelina lepadiformis TaxID=159417 RepID=UPI0040438073
MTTPHNHRPSEASNGSVFTNEYDNPVYDTDIHLEDDVIDDKVEVKFEGSDVNSEVNVYPKDGDERPKRHRDVSVSPSVDYDDIISAANLTEEIQLSTSGPPGVYVNTTQRHSGIVRKRKSHDVIQEEDDEFFHRELILKIRKTLPLKDFRDEIRARRDLEKFLVSPVVLLDVPHTSLDKIIAELLSKLQKDLDVDEKITSEAEKAFFTFQEQYQDSLGSVDQLRETIQGVQYRPDGSAYEETWITALCSLPMLKKSHVGIARLRNPLNLGNKCEEVLFVIAVIAPKKEKFTKNAVEIGRTFSSMMCNQSFRHNLAAAKTEEEFKDVLILQSTKYKREVRESMTEPLTGKEEDEFVEYSYLQVGRGIYDDLKRRLPHYWSDYKDGVVGKHTLHKLVATVFFLYFACLLPDIAFGTLYETTTDKKIDVTSAVMSQTIGGLAFAIFSGQPMLIILTTAPLALYVKVIMIVSDSFDLNFRAMYAMTGLWNSIFLILEAFFNLSKLMKYSSRSTEEIFGFFIALAFTADAVKATIKNFEKNYHFKDMVSLGVTSTAPMVTTSNTTDFFTPAPYNMTEGCELLGDKLKCYKPEESILFLFLMLGTLWLGMTILRFDESQFLSATKREILADYALPISVVCLSFIGAYLFRAIDLENFNVEPGKNLFILAPVSELPPLAHLGAMGLGLCLSCLFFVDQNVSAAIVNAPANKLKKGPAYHWDLLVIGLINVVLSIFTLPWVHAALPHSPLHVKALADVEQHVSNFGTVHDDLTGFGWRAATGSYQIIGKYRIVKVRETRLTSILSHILIGLSIFLLPYMQYWIPVAVLQGLFLFLGLTSFNGNQMFDRMMLLFTEGSSYPPNHYVRKVPQRILHLFTLCQVIQLVIVAFFGFAEQYYLKMIFPVIILLLLPIRHKVLPWFIERKYLAVLDT